jgi:hypothetical protein
LAFSLWHLEVRLEVRGGETDSLLIAIKNGKKLAHEEITQN